MADIEEGIRGRLLEITALTAITTTIRCDVFAETDNGDAILINVMEQRRDTDLTGDGRLVHSSVMINCCSLRKQQARAMEHAIIGSSGSGLETYSGTNNGITFDVDAIPQITFNAAPLNDGSDGYQYSIDIEVQTTHTE